MAQSILGKRAHYHFSETNLGLSASVIRGVSHVIAQHGAAIVVEDDLDVSPHFLTYMNQALSRYAESENIFQISGFMPVVPQLSHVNQALFLPFTVSWGWATWSRAWRIFDPHASGWQELQKNKRLRYQFNLDGNYDYALMLERQMQGLRDSWAIRWYWSVFKQHGLTLFPPHSLVRNTGFDGSGTHGRALLRKVSGGQAVDLSPLPLLPEQLTISEVHYAFVKQAIWRQNGGYLGFAADQIKKLLR